MGLEEWKVLAQLAQESEIVDPIDWGYLNISEEDAYNLMAMHVAELENDPIPLKSMVVKLLVENFVLNLRLLNYKELTDGK